MLSFVCLALPSQFTPEIEQYGVKLLGLIKMVIMCRMVWNNVFVLFCLDLVTAWRRELEGGTWRRILKTLRCSICVCFYVLFVNFDIFLRKMISYTVDPFFTYSIPLFFVRKIRYSLWQSHDSPIWHLPLTPHWLPTPHRQRLGCSKRQCLAVPQNVHTYTLLVLSKVCQSIFNVFSTVTLAVFRVRTVTI